MSMMTMNSNPIGGLSQEKIDLIKRTLCKGSTNDELELFLHTCARLQLDPLMKQIYAVKRKNHKEGTETMTIQTGIDGYRILADRTGKYSPGREPTFTYDKDGNVLSATSYVKKLGADGTWHEVGATAFWDEYVQTTKDFKSGDSKPNSFWERMPHAQLAKCAESLALRRAFPADLSGIRTDEEMGQADNVTIEVDSKTGEIKPPEKMEFISPSQAQQLESMIGDDLEYKKSILGFYKVGSFTKLDSKMIQFLVGKIQKHNEEKINAGKVVEQMKMLEGLPEMPASL